MADLKSCLFTTSCLLISALMLICLYSQARNSSRDHTLRRGKPKNQNLSEGPETFGFFGFPRVFLGFPTEIPKNHMVFLNLGGNRKKSTGCFWFSCSVSGEKPKKTLCFLDFCWRTKNTIFFWISVWKPRKTKKIQKSRATQKGFGFLDFWFCSAFDGNIKTKNPKPV